jgi:hypothetical protein
MSANGTTQTLDDVRYSVAFGGNPDIRRLWQKGRNGLASRVAWHLHNAPIPAVTRKNDGDVAS